MVCPLNCIYVCSCVLICTVYFICVWDFIYLFNCTNVHLYFWKGIFIFFSILLFILCICNIGWWGAGLEGLALGAMLESMWVCECVGVLVLMCFMFSTYFYYSVFCICQYCRTPLKMRWYISRGYPRNKLKLNRSRCV